MEESLQAVKARIRNQYLGKAGIHGLGIRQKEGAIMVHITPGVDGGREEILEEIKRSVIPHKLIVVEEEPPTSSN